MEAPSSEWRRYRGLSHPLADYKTIKRALGGTVNDAVLAVVAGALRAWLLNRGEDVAPDADVDVVLRGDIDALAFMAFWVSGNTVLAGMQVNLWDATDGIRELVVSGRPVDRDRLADADVPLEEV